MSEKYNLRTRLGDKTPNSVIRYRAAVEPVGGGWVPKVYWGLALVWEGKAHRSDKEAYATAYDKMKEIEAAQQEAIEAEKNNGG